MKIHRNPQDHQWVLSSGPHVLYRGARSPWLSPELLREAARRERQLQDSQSPTASAER